MSCGIDRRLSLDPTLLWLWHRPAAVALIRSLAWELPHDVDVAFKKKKKNVLLKEKNGEFFSEGKCHRKNNIYIKFLKLNRE